jgi:Ring finger domain
MAWLLFAACRDTLFGRRGSPHAENSNPLIVESNSFDTPVLLPAEANRSYEAPQPPTYADAALLVNKLTDDVKESKDSSNAVYLRGVHLENDEECPICLGNPTDIVARPACGHWFHPECLFDWLDRSPHRGCPICDTKISTEIVVEDTQQP